MAPMGIRLSPLGMGVLALLTLAVLYHLYAGFLGGRLSALWMTAGEEDAASRVELRSLLAVSLLAAKRGGEAVKSVRSANTLREKSKGKTREGADDKITDGDVLSNRQMYFTLRNTFPGLQINSEEQVGADDQEHLSWDGIIPDDITNIIPDKKEVPANSITIWIDPLDATLEYTDNLLNYVTTMVCVAVYGEPVIGVVHKPFSGYTAWAMVDGGTNLKARSSYDEANPRIIVSRSHTGTVQEVIRKTFGNNTVIIQAGGAGYKVLSLMDVPDDAQEKADIYIHKTYIKKWDICAGNALLKAVGGKMTTLEGKEIQYADSEVNKEGIIASIGMDHSMLVKKLSGKIPDIEKKKH
ncbi:Golgi-resident adenosine 3',5'-bisphosphate 3'-phosphatase [Ambystoma mexicanum]|uniref:Golgi-resident adenosine 3',5'-bisphosphate 3'-phosphatase n=1 Tax=Ambystoma mexicanum TaxID=8296 RepID=UPI0037E927D1